MIGAKYHDPMGRGLGRDAAGGDGVEDKEILAPGDTQVILAVGHHHGNGYGKV